MIKHWFTGKFNVRLSLSNLPKCAFFTIRMQISLWLIALRLPESFPSSTFWLHPSWSALLEQSSALRNCQLHSSLQIINQLRLGPYHDNSRRSLILEPFLFQPATAPIRPFGLPFSMREWLVAFGQYLPLCTLRSVCRSLWSWRCTCPGSRTCPLMILAWESRCHQSNSKSVGQLWT